MWRTTRAKACWSLIDSRQVRRDRRPAFSSMKARQRSSTLPALAGGFWPVSFSRTIMRHGLVDRRIFLALDTGEIRLGVFLRQHRVEVGGHAVHAQRADRFDTRLLDGIEDGAGIGALRRHGGVNARVVAGQRSAMESPRPRVTASSCAVGRLEISGRRMRSPVRPGRSLANVTSTSPSPAIERTQPVIARRNGSISTGRPGLLFELSPRPAMTSLRYQAALGLEHDVGGAFLQLDAEGALIVLGHQRTLQLVALVEEGDAEGKGDITEDLGVFSPGDDGTRAHDGRQVAVDEGGAGQVGNAHHLRDGLAAVAVLPKLLTLAATIFDFVARAAGSSAS